MRATRRVVRELGERAVSLDHLAKADERGVLQMAGAPAGKELPCAVLLVMGHEQNRLPPEGYRLGGKDSDVGWVVEGPGHVVPQHSQRRRWARRPRLHALRAAHLLSA